MANEKKVWVNFCSKYLNFAGNENIFMRMKTSILHSTSLFYFTSPIALTLCLRSVNFSQSSTHEYSNSTKCSANETCSSIILSYFRKVLVNVFARESYTCQFYFLNHWWCLRWAGSRSRRSLSLRVIWGSGKLPPFRSYPDRNGCSFLLSDKVSRCTHHQTIPPGLISFVSSPN